MASLSLTHKRVIAALYLGVLMTCAGSYYLDWGLFRGADRQVLAVVTLIGVVAVGKYGAAMLDELKEYQRKRRGA